MKTDDYSNKLLNFQEPALRRPEDYGDLHVSKNILAQNIFITDFFFLYEKMTLPFSCGYLPDNMTSVNSMRSL